MDSQSRHQLPVCFYPSLCGYELHCPILLLLPYISSAALLSLSLATNQPNRHNVLWVCSTWLINTHIQRLHYTPGLSRAETGIFCTTTKIKQPASLWTHYSNIALHILQISVICCVLTHIALFIMRFSSVWRKDSVKKAGHKVSFGKTFDH